MHGLSTQTAAPLPPLARAAALTIATARFAHACNTRAKVLAACALPDDVCNVLEADVILARAGPEAASGVAAVLGHAVGDAHDCDVAFLLEHCLRSGKGVKLDVKQFAALRPALDCVRRADEDDGGVAPWRVLRLFRAAHGAATAASAGVSFDVPALIVNFDALSGTGARCAFNETGRPLGGSDALEIAAARAALSVVGSALPSALLSLGWTTAGDGEGRTYSEAQLAAMAAAVVELCGAGLAVTFAVRASYVRGCWGGPHGLQAQLLEPFPCTSLTVWSNAALPPGEEAWLRKTLPPERAMFDLLGDGEAPRNHAHEAVESGPAATKAWHVVASAAVGAAVAVVAATLAMMVAAAMRRRLRG